MLVVRSKIKAAQTCAGFREVLLDDMKGHTNQ